MKLIRCDSCGRTDPEADAKGWLVLVREGEEVTWHFCSVGCLATWSAEAM